jgi:glutaredoxin 3
MMRTGAAGVNCLLIARFSARCVPAMGWKWRTAGTTLGHMMGEQVSGAIVEPGKDTPGEAEHPPITLYTSAVCGYCMAAKNFLKSRGLAWNEVRVDLDPTARERMVSMARRTSVPQIFVGDVHVGGYDDMIALHRAGRFEPLLGGDAP